MRATDGNHIFHTRIVKQLRKPTLTCNTAIEGNEILQAVLEKDVQEGTGEVITTSSGLQYVDIKIGGGVFTPNPIRFWHIGSKLLCFCRACSAPTHA